MLKRGTDSRHLSRVLSGGVTRGHEVALRADGCSRGHHDIIPHTTFGSAFVDRASTSMRRSRSSHEHGDEQQCLDVSVERRGCVRMPEMVVRIGERRSRQVDRRQNVTGPGDCTMEADKWSSKAGSFLVLHLPPGLPRIACGMPLMEVSIK